MREAQIYIKKHLKKDQINLCWGGGVVSQLGDLYPPRGGGKNITA